MIIGGSIRSKAPWQQVTCGHGAPVIMRQEVLPAIGVLRGVQMHTAHVCLPPPPCAVSRRGATRVCVCVCAHARVRVWCACGCQSGMRLAATRQVAALRVHASPLRLVPVPAAGGCVRGRGFRVQSCAQGAAGTAACSRPACTVNRNVPMQGLDLHAYQEAWRQASTLAAAVGRARLPSGAPTAAATAQQGGLPGPLLCGGVRGRGLACLPGPLCGIHAQDAWGIGLRRRQLGRERLLAPCRVWRGLLAWCGTAAAGSAHAVA